MSVKYIFPISIASKICNFDSHKIIECLYQIKQYDKFDITYSNVKGWHSSPNLQCNENIILNLSNLISDIKELLDEMGIEVKMIDIHSMWGMINPPGSYNLSHIHGHCILSGILYLKTPENSGRIVFENYIDEGVGLYNLLKNPEFTNSYSSFSITPESNLLLLFHPNLRYHVEINESLDDRISISFNINLS